jgi:uncharacterized protein YciI
MTTVLTYEYVPDVVERRGPYRPGHLALIDEWVARGTVLAAGATGDPPTGALIVFDADPADVERFVADDPYVSGGLVSEHRIEPWSVVAGAGVPEPPPRS